MCIEERGLSVQVQFGAVKTIEGLLGVVGQLLVTEHRQCPGVINAGYLLLCIQE